MIKKSVPVIGWREWVALPDLGINHIKAKIDTGARTSALHAIDIRITGKGNRKTVNFRIHPLQRDTQRTVSCRARLLDYRWVRSSNGRRELRPVIRTALSILDQEWEIEVTLTSRDLMGFRMLLGREAVRRRCLIHPARSFLTGDGKRRWATVSRRITKPDKRARK